MGLGGQELKHSPTIKSQYCTEQIRGALSIPLPCLPALHEHDVKHLHDNFWKKHCWHYIASKCWLWRRWEVVSDGKVRQSIHGCKKISKSSSERILTSENHCVRFLQLLARRDSPVCFRWLQPLPELVCHEDDTALQQQGGEDADDLPHAQALEEALKVHVLQAGVHGPPQLNDLHTPKKLQSAALARLAGQSASSASTAPACLLRAHRMKWTPAPRANWGCRHSAPEKRCIAQFLSCHSSQNTAVCTVCYHLQGKHNSPFQTFCKRCKAWLSGEYEASNNQTLELEAFRAETAIKSR